MSDFEFRRVDQSYKDGYKAGLKDGYKAGLKTARGILEDFYDPKLIENKELSTISEIYKLICEKIDE